MFRNQLNPDQAWQKIKHYCAYQERCHYEVREKLFGFGLRKNDVEALMSRLIEEDYLNESRFAIQFAGGHFRLKKWGRIKIGYELKQKKISTTIIKLALQEIDITDYKLVLLKLAQAKWRSLKQEQYLKRRAKTTQYLIQKGFEPVLIQEAIAELQNTSKE